MNWIPLVTEDQIEDIKTKSSSTPQVIFKHSIRCGTSGMAKNRLEKANSPEQADFYFLDIIRHRNISNKIAEDFNIQHESPQVLLIENGNCVYNESHLSIDMEEIKLHFS